AYAGQLSVQKRMISLPTTWPGGSRSTMCPISAYVMGTPALVHGPLAPTAPGTATPVVATSGSGAGTGGTGAGTSTSTTPTPSLPGAGLPAVDEGAPGMLG